jgi:tRNA A-37 threonylcarbamoyl transferase component Bud32
MAREVPRGFRHLRRGGIELVVAAEFEPAAVALGLLEADAFERAFSAPAGHGRAPTALLALAPQGPRLHLRRLLHGGLLGPLLRSGFLGVSRPVAELAVTQRLRDAGAPVPRAALVLARRVLGPLRACAVGTVFEEDSADAAQLLAGRPRPERMLRAAAAAGRAVRSFHDAGGRHADLHVKNLLLRERDGADECLVIDLDKARIASDPTPAERMSELMRLFRSLVKRDLLDPVGARGCARFFSAYCGDDRRLRAAMWRRVRAELRKVEVHRVGYRASRRGSASLART